MKKIASISIDLEDLSHAYRLYRHNKKSDNSVYEKAVPRILEIFDRHQIKATFFIIGEDLKHKTNQDMLCEIINQGHEVANHTYSHFWKGNLKDPKYLFQDIVKNEEALENLIQKKIVGFRSPFWAINPIILDILEQRNYLYDSSILPSYYFIFGKHLLRKVHKKNIPFSHPLHCLAPTVPYHPHTIPWKKGNYKIIELPLTQVPWLRFPFYSTILFFGGDLFLKFAYPWITRQTSFLNFQLHGIDLLEQAFGFGKLSSLSYPLNYKKDLLNALFHKISIDYTTYPLQKAALHFKAHKKFHLHD